MPTCLADDTACGESCWAWCRVNEEEDNRGEAKEAKHAGKQKAGEKDGRGRKRHHSRQHKRSRSPEVEERKVRPLFPVFTGSLPLIKGSLQASALSSQRSR